MEFVSKVSSSIEECANIPPQCFCPTFIYVDELLDTDEDEGRLNYRDGDKYDQK